MSRYIDADKLNAKLMDEYYGMISDESMKIYKIMQMLDNAPTADVQEAKHGKWDVKDLTPYCSICHKPSEYECDGVHSQPLFCPNCGAKMDGGDSK